MIKKSAKVAVKCALNNQSGVIGLDEDFDNKMSCIEFSRIKGGKPFDTNIEWYTKTLKEIKQI